MAIFDIIALVVLVGSLIIIGLMVGRKFPTLASIDVRATIGMLEERKSSLLEQRLRRKFHSMWERFEEQGSPASKKVRQWWGVLHQRLVDLEHEYKIRALPVLLNRFQRRKIDVEIAAIIEQAEALLVDGETKAAEEKALQAIRLEPRSVPAFEFLGDLYLKSKEYSHAKEIYLYLLKLLDDDEAVFQHESTLPEGRSTAVPETPVSPGEVKKHALWYQLDLAYIYRMLADWPNAFEAVQEAARLEPMNPKVLDEYIEISIGSSKKQFAQDALQTIRQTNPDNSKIGEWEERIAAIPSKPIRANLQEEVLEPSQSEEEIDRS